MSGSNLTPVIAAARGLKVATTVSTTSASEGAQRAAHVSSRANGTSSASRGRFHGEGALATMREHGLALGALTALGRFRSYSARQATRPLPRASTGPSP